MGLVETPSRVDGVFQALELVLVEVGTREGDELV